jgi:hypothetical protein
MWWYINWALSLFSYCFQANNRSLLPHTSSLPRRSFFHLILRYITCNLYL